jgi:hypothetical protein
VQQLGKKIAKNIGKNQQKESADKIFTNTANIGTDPIPSTIIGRSIFNMTMVGIVCLWCDVNVKILAD